MTGGDSMDVISLDDWELLPDQESAFFMEEYTVGGKDQILLGADLVMINMDHFTPASHPSPYNCILDEEAKKPHQPPLFQDASDPVVEFKDIGVVHTQLSREESASKVSEVLISDADEEELIKWRAVVEEVCEKDEVMVEAAPDLSDEEEGVKGDRAGLECVGFSVGKLRVNGAGALCSFGVAAATFCIFLLGGKPQNQKKMQGQKIQFQMYADDERIQQAVEQASMLNQAMSSVMGGASTRASISFGGYYDGF
ncbi:uncharacterized protein LOC124697747 [Lolium rigidum]|uniref:uncharacterized protein LOC124697747 n=1 Tax=Lolium rigidum TaxID=89674 RepID=UPI001F5DAC33|nr:uncharacterized protein LOC124697747 [Lolium rigidum]